MSAVMSAGDEESQNRQRNEREEERRAWLALFTFVEFGKDALLAAVLVFQLGSFGRATFELDIELVDNHLLLRIVPSDVDGFWD